MLELFETKIEGKVNYSNFVEFVRESGVSSGLEGLTKKLFTLISTSGPRGMNVYIYICLYIYVCIYVYVCMYIYVYISSGLEGLANICVYRDVCVYTVYTYRYICVYAYTYIHIYKYVYIHMSLYI
jgi:hypothetical protein